MRVVALGNSENYGCWSGRKLTSIAMALRRRACWHVVTAGGSKHGGCWSGRKLAELALALRRRA